MSTPAATVAARHTTVPTPLGPFTVVVTADGAVLASGWTEDLVELLAAVHPALRPEPDALTRDDVATAVVREAVTAFADGDPRPVRDVAVHGRGGPLVESLWAHLREVEAGTRITYSELAARAGRPDAVRAAARACATNAATLFVPCHRVVRRDGGLGGYRWGLSVKERLLAAELLAAAVR